MKKPLALVQLLEELHGEGIHSTVEITKHSEAIIYPSADAAEDEDGIKLTAEDCLLLFANPGIVERLVDALNCGGDASLALFDVTVPHRVQEKLERSFIAVDEG